MFGTIELILQKCRSVFVHETCLLLFFLNWHNYVSMSSRFISETVDLSYCQNFDAVPLNTVYHKITHALFENALTLATICGPQELENTLFLGCMA